MIAILTLVAFLFIFSFGIPGIINSAYLSMLIISLLLIKDSSAFVRCMQIIRNKTVLFVIYSYIVIIIYSISVPVFKGTFDFSFIPTLINIFASFFFVIAIFSLFEMYTKKSEGVYAGKVWFYCILAQSFFVILMMFFPTVRVLINSFTISEVAIERMATYGGVRGLGLSGSVAFGFAIIMAFLVLLFTRWSILSGIKFSIFYFLLVLFSFAALSAGRTAIIGIFLAVLYYAFNKSLYGNIKLFCKFMLMVILSVLLLIIIIGYNEDIKNTLYIYSFYVFQFVYNYIDTGSASINSLQVLDSMYFFPPNDNLFFGDGWYTAENGSYYLGTDSGYMRYLLFFGIFGSSLMYLSFIVLTCLVASKVKLRSERFFLYLVVFMSFIFHYKGEVVYYNVAFMKLFFFLILMLMYRPQLNKIG